MNKYPSIEWNYYRRCGAYNMKVPNFVARVARIRAGTASGKWTAIINTRALLTGEEKASYNFDTHDLAIKAVERYIKDVINNRVEKAKQTLKEYT